MATESGADRALAASAVEPVSRLAPSGGDHGERSVPCPWCGSHDHWVGRVEMCWSRAACMVTTALRTLPEEGEGWQAYAMRLRKQLHDEAERVA